MILWRVNYTGYVIVMVIFLLFSQAVVGDLEPNDSIEEAEVISLGQVISGTLDSSTDAYDYYNITLDANQYVITTLDGPENADFDVNIYDANGTHLTGSTYDVDADEIIAFQPQEAGIYFVSIWAYDGNGPYSLSVRLPENTSQGTYTLQDALEYGFIDVEITGVFDGSEGSFDLKNGMNVFYGECIELTIESFVTNDFNITVPAGLLLISEDIDVEDKVITKTTTIHIQSFSQKSDKLYAMSINMYKDVPSLYTYFNVGEMATGDLLKIAQTIDSTNYQTVSGQIAIWMITDEATSTDVQQLGATSSQIEAAKLKLDEAGITPPKEEKDDGDDYWGNLVCLTSIIILIVFIIISVLRRRTKADKIPQKGPSFDEMEALEPSEMPYRVQKQPPKPPTGGETSQSLQEREKVIPEEHPKSEKQ